MKYKPAESHKSYIDPAMVEDITFTNHLALAAAILDPSDRKISYYLNGLYDKDVGDVRIQEIDRMNRQGIKTVLQDWYEKSVRSAGNKRESDRKQNTNTPTLVINTSLDGAIRYETLKEACDLNDLNYKSVNNKFWYRKSNEIEYKGLILRKLD